MEFKELQDLQNYLINKHSEHYIVDFVIGDNIIFDIYKSRFSYHHNGNRVIRYIYNNNTCILTQIEDKSPIDNQE